MRRPVNARCSQLLRAFAVSAVVVAWVPAAAPAALRIDLSPGRPGHERSLTVIDDAPGSVNDLLVTGSSEQLTIVDRSAPIRSVRGCFVGSAATAPYPAGTPVVCHDVEPAGTLALGAGDDRVVLPFRNDEESLTLNVDGGEGTDTIVYPWPDGVLVDLAAGFGGAPLGRVQPPRRDTLARIENVAGGPGADHLLGDEGANRLDGAGAAVPVNGVGDVLEARGGDDELNLRDGTVFDKALCGAGADVARVVAIDVAALDCERLFDPAGNLLLRPVVPAPLPPATPPPRQAVGDQGPVTSPPVVQPGPAPVVPPVAEQPVAGKSVVAEVARGVVSFQAPGSGRFIRLAGKTVVPVGSTFDTAHGRVRLRTGIPAGGTQHALVSAGRFQVRQERGSRRVTFALTGRPTGCLGHAAQAAARRAGRRQPAQLWGEGKGRFRMRGRNGAATVRGTTWFMQERCTGTLMSVKRGEVSVRDFVRHRTLILRTGERFLSRYRDNRR